MVTHPRQILDTTTANPAQWRVLLQVVHRRCTKSPRNRWSGEPCTPSAARVQLLRRRRKRGCRHHASAGNAPAPEPCFGDLGRTALTHELVNSRHISIPKFCSTLLHCKTTDKSTFSDFVIQSKGFGLALPTKTINSMVDQAPKSTSRPGYPLPPTPVLATATFPDPIAAASRRLPARVCGIQAQVPGRDETTDNDVFP